MILPRSTFKTLSFGPALRGMQSAPSADRGRQIMADHNMKKCAHPACNCQVEKGKKYCSDYCHDARRTLELSCNCRHPACAEEAAAASA